MGKVQKKNLPKEEEKEGGKKADFFGRTDWHLWDLQRPRQEFAAACHRSCLASKSFSDDKIDKGNFLCQSLNAAKWFYDENAEFGWEYVIILTLMST